MDKRAFVQVQVSSRQITAHRWTKNIYMFGYIGEGKRNSWTSLASSLSQVAQLSAKETFPVHDSSHGECVNEYPSSPTLQDTAKETYFSPTRVLNCELPDWGVGRGWEQQIGHSEGIKGCGS